MHQNSLMRCEIDKIEQGNVGRSCSTNKIKKIRADSNCGNLMQMAVKTKAEVKQYGETHSGLQAAAGPSEFADGSLIA